MAGDYSRATFDALNDFSGVFLQQGRAMLDADWNEMVRVFERRVRAECVDTIGRAVVPRETIDGFRIRFTPAGGIEIGRGRKYLDGMLLECHGHAEFAGEDLPDADPPVFDRGRFQDGAAVGVLDEMISPEAGDFLPYDAQPYWPTPDPLPEPDEDGNPPGVHIAYLVAWQREVTPIERPDLLEPALGGIDTTTRRQTVWQVRLFGPVSPNTNCETPDGQIDEWVETIAPSTARLTTGTIEIEDPQDPCLVPPTEGYSGLENQFYRVELHVVGDAQDEARFKFSRENASVVAAVETIGSPANTVTVASIGRDEKLSFKANDWVELTDDHRELNHRCGRMLRIAEVFEETREIVFEEAIDDAPGNDDLIPSGVGSDTPSARRARLIRWDQRGRIRLADGTEIANLDDETSDGLIPVPADGSPVVLEAGITVSFTTAPGPGAFREMDHWRFCARTAGTEVEARTSAPPDGVQRHHCRLAVLRSPNSIDDCREFWPPQFEGGPAESCGCTVCVTPESHASGTLTLQSAVDQIGAAGGTVCVEAGSYLLDAPLMVEERGAIRVIGQGIGTIFVYRGNGAAIRLAGSTDIELERFTLFVLPAQEDDVGAIPPTHGITALDCALIALRRLAVVVLGGDPGDRSDHAIGLDGLQIATKIEECVAIAPIALGSRSSFDLDPEEPDDPAFVAFLELRALDNIFFGGRDAVRFDRVAINGADAVLSRNLIVGIGTGVRINWAEIPTGATIVSESTVQSAGDGLILGATDLRLKECEITAGEEVSHGVRLVRNIVPDALTSARIIANSIFDCAGAGISIEGDHDSLMIKQNVIERSGLAGVLTAGDATIRSLSIENNRLAEIAGTLTEANAVGILVMGADHVGVSNNVITAVGRGGASGGTSAGIALQGVGTIGVDGNVLSQIGPDLAESRAYAILLRQPYTDARIAGNQIAGASEPNELTGWVAIAIGVERARDPSTGLGPATNAYTAAVPNVNAADVAFVGLDQSMIRITERSAAVVSASSVGQPNVSGNQIRAAIRLTGPIVSIFDPAASALNFGGNQSLLNSGGGSSPVVLLGAQRLTVQSNVMQHQSDALTLELVARDTRSAAVLGNMTTAGITLNNQGLPPPFGPLNLNA